MHFVLRNLEKPIRIINILYKITGFIGQNEKKNRKKTIKPENKWKYSKKKLEVLNEDYLYIHTYIHTYLISRLSWGSNRSYLSWWALKSYKLF